MATAVEISILVDSDSAVAALASMNAALAEVGISGTASIQKTSAAVDALVVDFDAAAASMAAMSSTIMSVASEEEAALLKARVAAQQTQAEFVGASAALAAMNSEIGIEGARSMEGMNGALQKMGGHVQTNLDGVRLLSQEFGLRMPRALESMVARMGGLSTVINSVVGGLAAVAVAEIAFRSGEAVYELYKKWIDTDGAIEDYTKKAAQAASMKLFDSSSFETTIATLQQVNTELDKMKDKRSNAPSFMSLMLDTMESPDLPSNKVFTRDDATHLTKAQGESDANYLRNAQQKHEDVLKTISDEHKLAQAKLEGAAKANDVLGEARAKAVENRSYTQAHEAKLAEIANRGKHQGDAGYAVVAPDAGQSDYTHSMNAANATKTGEDVAMHRTAQDQIRKLREETTLAGLHGVAQLQAAERNEETELQTSYGRGLIDYQDMTEKKGALEAQLAAKIGALEAQLAAKIGALHKASEIETAALQQQANEAGMKGSQLILAQETATNARIDELVKSTELTEEQGQQRRAIAHQVAMQKIDQLEKQFTDEARSMNEQRVDASLKGYARIEAEAAHAVAVANQRYQQDFQNAKLTDEQKRQAFAAYESELSSIQQSGLQKRADLQEKASQEMAQYDQEANSAEARVREDGMLGWAASYKDTIAAIESEHAQHVERLKASAQEMGLTDQQVGVARIDLDRQENAQIEEAHARMADQISGTLQAAFSDPVGAIKSVMETMFAHIIANWLMQTDIFKNVLGQSIGGMKMPGAQGGATGAVAQGGGSLGAILQGGGGSSSGVWSEQPGFGGGGGSGASYSGASAPAGSSGAIASMAGGSGPGPAGMSFSSAMGSAQDIGGQVKSIASLYKGARASQAASTSPGLVRAAAAASGGSGGPLLPGLPSGQFTLDPGGLNGPGGSPTDPMSESLGMPSGGTFGIDPGGLNGPGGMSSTASGASGVLAGVGAIGGGIAGGYGMYQAFLSGKPSGMLSGAMAGAGAGAAIGMLGGPVGALIGAGIGAATGFAAGLLGFATGEGERMAGRAYYYHSILPAITQILDSYQRGNGGDYQSAESSINLTAAQGFEYIRANIGGDGAKYVKDTYIDKEVAVADSAMERMASAGRENITMQAKQFHSGGFIDGFGGLGTSHNEGYIHAMLGESVVHADATARHRPAIQAMNSGADEASIAAMYLNGGRRSAMPMQSGGSGDTHFHVHTLDTKTMRGWLRDGGAQMIKTHLNGYNNQYAGAGNG